MQEGMLLPELFSTINFFSKMNFPKSWNVFLWSRREEKNVFFLFTFYWVVHFNTIYFKNISLLLALIPLLRKHILDMFWSIHFESNVVSTYRHNREYHADNRLFQGLRKLDRFYGHITLLDIPVCAIYFLYYLGWKPSCPNYLQQWSWTRYLITSSLETLGKSE